MLVVTHNREISRIAHRVIELSSGGIVSRRADPGGRAEIAELVVSDGPAPALAAWSLATCAGAGSGGAIAMVIAIGTGVYAGLGSMEPGGSSQTTPASKHCAPTTCASRSTEGTRAPAGTMAPRRAIPLAARSRPRRSGCVAPDPGRRSGRAESILAPGRSSARRSARRPLIDGVWRRRPGAPCSPRDSGRPVGVLERGFAEYHDLPDAGTIRLARGRRLRYVGVSGSPECFFVTRPAAAGSASPRPTSRSSSPRSHRAAARGRPGRVNEP